MTYSTQSNQFLYKNQLSVSQQLLNNVIVDLWKSFARNIIAAIEEKRARFGCLAKLQKKLKCLLGANIW